ncbi:hypothetical protein KSP40_PGU007030 [Platanthera guangdongensis]|uniref:TPX2 C-terminal domain-containing protein n=1 Tax=Platanthera guangdongensis TaxID=2320717 RepID=A0ABR2M7D6_9ASPA
MKAMHLPIFQASTQIKVVSVKQIFLNPSTKHMEDPIIFYSPKETKFSAVSYSLTGRKSGRSGQLPPFKVQTEQRRHAKEQKFMRKQQEYATKDAQYQIQIAQDPPPSMKKFQNPAKNSSVKSQKKPQVNFRLHTEERASRRAGFDHLVASKISSFEILRRFEEKIQKVIEEEEIKIMRKEMVPKAQLMPIFDRPFLPQRSTRALTVPKEPNLRFVNKYCGGSQDSYGVRRSFSHNLKTIR